MIFITHSIELGIWYGTQKEDIVYGLDTSAQCVETLPKQKCNS